MAETSTRWWLTQDSTETIIDAPPERIYALVADMPRMGEWSPECQRVEWLGGSDNPVVGATFIGHNEGGPANLMKWSRKGRVLAADPGREFAFVTEEGGRESTEWHYRFEPAERGTRVVESYAGAMDSSVGPDRGRPDQPGPRTEGWHGPHARPAQDGRRRGHRTRGDVMTTEVATPAFLLGSDEGEGVWFADSLLSYKVTGDETHGQLALAEVRAPRGSGSPVHTHRHEDEAWYVLEGELTFWLGEESRTATTGDFVFGPRGFATGSVSTPRWPDSSSSSHRPGSRTSPERAAGRRRPGPSRLRTCPHTAKRNSSPQPDGTASTSPRRRARSPVQPAPKGPTLGEAMPDAPRSADDHQINQHKGAHHDHHLQGSTGHRRPDHELPHPRPRPTRHQLLRAPWGRPRPGRHGSGRRA